MSKQLLRLSITGLILLQVFFPLNIWAQGNLLITPRRVVFEGNKRSMDLNLANIGTDTATYAISLIEIRMTEAGGFESITEPDEGQRFASPYLRFFPRTVTLGPNEAQTVKLQVVKSGTLEPGEYRSHLYFRAVPKEKPLGEEE
ncbi:molecular chaperone, partial [bacterium]|nr:molecular chaperone [bacterium]